MNSVVQSTATKYGLIAAAINVGWLLIAYLIDLSLFVNPFAGIAIWVVGLVIYILSAAQVKKQFGGYITFKNAFAAFIIAYIINALISLAVSLVLFNFVDPGAREEIMDMTIAKSVEMFENFGMSQSDIDETISQMEGQDNFSLGSQLQGLLTGILVYAIIGLIVAAIIKKNPPQEEYLESTQQ